MAGFSGIIYWLGRRSDHDFRQSNRSKKLWVGLGAN